jgi:hypothetical protein
MRKRTTPVLMFLLLAALLAMGVQAQEDAPPDPAQPDGVSLTVYNRGTALVQDRRTFNLEQGDSVVDFTDVASTINATSVIIKSITDPDGTVVLEQNYVFDLVDTSALLMRYIDEVISVTMSDGTVYTGILLSGAYGDIILREENGQVVVLHAGEARDIRFPALPDGLITRPTLRWFLRSEQGGSQQMELTYLAGGMTWAADYNFVLATDNTSLDVNGWVTVTNTSGTTYRDAQLKLIAGDVNRIMDDFADADIMMERAQTAMPSAAPGVAQREFFEYQLYEINRRVTLNSNETKQVEFVSEAEVPSRTFYVYDGSYPFYGYYSPIYDTGYGNTGITTVGTYLEFSTGDDGGLGADLPAGNIRVYQRDTDGSALLIGENTINHTPEGEDVQLYLGNAFDLVGERIQLSFNQISRDVYQETYEIRLRNRKDDETVEIRVPERLFRWSNWEIIQTSHDFAKTDSASVEFRVDVPPGEETVITYTVQYVFNR